MPTGRLALTPPPDVPSSTVLNLSTARDFLRDKFATDLTGLRAEIARVGGLAMHTRVTITGQSYEGGSHQGVEAFTAMEYLRALLDIKAELDPNTAAAPSCIRYADHSSRCAE